MDGSIFFLKTLEYERVMTTSVKELKDCAALWAERKSLQWLQELKATDSHQKHQYKENKTETPNLIYNCPSCILQKWGK